MTNDNGPQLRLMRNGRAKYDIITALHLFIWWAGSQQKAASLIGITQRNLRHALRGRDTEIKLATVQRAARQYVERYRDEVDKYEWAALLRMLRLIDPTSDILEVKVRDGLAKQVRKHMEDFPTNWPSSWLHHFSRQGVNKETLRITIRRILAKNPHMAEYDIDYKDDYPAVMPDPIDKAIKWVGATGEPAAAKRKKSGGSSVARKKAARRVRDEIDKLDLRTREDKPFVGEKKYSKATLPPATPVESQSDDRRTEDDTPDEPVLDPEARERVNKRIAELLKTADELPD